MLKIPFSVLPARNLQTLAHPLLGIGEAIRPFFPFLDLHLKQAEYDVDSREYLSMCVISTGTFFLMMGFLLSLSIGSFEKEGAFVRGFLIALVVCFFVFFQQVMYPKMLGNKKIRNIEINLLPASQNMLVQLNSGVPLFDILVNLSRGDYGEVSKEFERAVKEINAGKPQIDALEELAVRNPSLFFRRTIWQMVNGMKSGANMSKVVEEALNSLSEEQVLQIQRYGGQLNPLAMFYMMIAVIIPSLGMTFLIVITSFIPMAPIFAKLIFWSLYGFVFFCQIMFMGVIKSRRPNLLGED
jgi:flagellar protein FlaJ